MQKINNRYEFDPKTDELGKGGFGRVFKARDTLLNREVVLKIVQKDNLPDKYSLVQEIGRVIDFNHPNLVRYYDAIVMHNVNSFGEEIEYQIGVMEYVRNGDLRAFIQTQPTEQQIREILIGILRGLGYLHDKGLIHRDIKPPNILLNIENGAITAKLCDFGISKMVGSEATTLSNVIGTFEYMSPEQLGSNSEQKINTNSDLWSVGVMIYEMFTGELPFGSRRSGTTDAKIVGNILAGDIPAKITEIPDPYRDIVEVCLIRDLETRASSANELLQLLKKPKLTVNPKSSEKKQTETQPNPLVPQNRKNKVQTAFWFLAILPVIIIMGSLFGHLGISLFYNQYFESGFLSGAILMVIVGWVLYRNFPKPIQGIYLALFITGILGLIEFISFIMGAILYSVLSHSEYMYYNHSSLPVGMASILGGTLFVSRFQSNLSTGGIFLISFFMIIMAFIEGFFISSKISPSLAMILASSFILVWIILATSLIRSKSAHKYLWLVVRILGFVLVLVTFFSTID